MTDSSWGWTSYKRTGWVSDDDPDLRLYEALFYKDNRPNTYTRSRVDFWAHRPILALRLICASGKDPSIFHRQEVN